jgi:hypothetical protein
MLYFDLSQDGTAFDVQRSDTYRPIGQKQSRPFAAVQGRPEAITHLPFGSAGNCGLGQMSYGAPFFFASFCMSLAVRSSASV